MADSSRIRVGGEGVGPQDQIGLRRADRRQIRRTAGADRGQIVHGGAEVGRLAVGAVGQGGGDDAGLQAQRTQRVQLVAGEHHDLLRFRANHGAACGVADVPVALARIDRQRIGRAGLVWPALITQHAGARDPGGAGDDRRLIGG